MAVTTPSDDEYGPASELLEEFLKLSGAKGALLRNASGRLVVTAGTIPGWSPAKLQSVYAAALATEPHFQGVTAFEASRVYAKDDLPIVHAHRIPSRRGWVLLGFHNAETTAGMVSLYAEECARKLAAILETQ